MVHCNPMMAIQSIHQPVHTAYAAQSHAPGHFVELAKIQQHETSEHQGKSPQPVMVALLLSHDSIFAGSAIHTKVNQSLNPCFQHHTFAHLLLEFSDVFCLLHRPPAGQVSQSQS